MASSLSKKTDAPVIWFTGLPAAGKSTLANRLAEALKGRGHRVEILDGDEIRERLSKGLGFTRVDRDENVARIAFVADMLARNGVIVLVAAVSPYRAARQKARDLLPGFQEVYVSTPLGECIRRDPKGLYELANAGRIEHFTGVSDIYEAPECPDLEIDTCTLSIDSAVALIQSKFAF